MRHKKSRHIVRVSYYMVIVEFLMNKKKKVKELTLNE